MIERFWRRCRELNDDAESGQVMVEFALVFPVQLFLTLCVIQFAFMAHATIVVNQAAFMGARAGAVAVVNRDVSVPEAGRREAARHVALLTTGGSDITGGDVPTDGSLEWNTKDGSYGFSQARQNEAYALLKTTTQRVDGTSGGGGYVFCDVTFDYIMVIPVANHFFAKVTPGGGADVGGGDRRTTYRIRRVGFVPIPWTQKPLN